MRVPIALLAALLALAPAHAQRRPAPPPAAPTLELTEAQQAELQQAVARGRMMAALLEASRISTRDMLVRLPAAQRDAITGWVGQPEGNGVTVTFFGRAGEDYVAIYRGQVVGARVGSPTVYPADARPPLTGVAARMAAARMAAEASSNRPCGGTSFNTLVLPPDGDGPITVYQISPRASATTLQGGGHFRLTVAADGTVSDNVPLTGACETLTPPTAPAAGGQPPRPLLVNAREAALPNEAHVLMSFWAGGRLVVATGTAAIRLWGVTPRGIGELHQ